jgi:hypothetical protein
MILIFGWCCIAVTFVLYWVFDYCNGNVNGTGTGTGNGNGNGNGNCNGDDV